MFNTLKRYCTKFFYIFCGYLLYYSSDFKKSTAKKNEFQEGVASLTSEINLNPKKSDNYLLRGVALIGVKDFQGVLDDFDSAIYLNPHYFVNYSKKTIEVTEKEWLVWGKIDVSL